MNGLVTHPPGLGHGDVLDELAEADGVDEGHGEDDVAVQPVDRSVGSIQIQIP